MYKWKSCMVQKVYQINKGNVTDNSYLGWKNPRRNQIYVGLSSEGIIEWTYKWNNGKWSKFDSNNVEYEMLPTEFNLTLTANNGNIDVSVDSPNQYDSTTGKVTKMTVADVEISLTATAAEGYEFVKWKKGDMDYSIENPLIEEADGENDLEYTAVFQSE